MAFSVKAQKTICLILGQCESTFSSLGSLVHSERTQMRGSNIELLEVDISEIEEKIFESAFFSFQLFELIAKKQKLCSLFVNKSYDMNRSLN